MRGKNVNDKTMKNMWLMLENQTKEIEVLIWDGDQLSKPNQRKLSNIPEIDSEFEESNSNMTSSALMNKA